MLLGMRTAAKNVLSAWAGVLAQWALAGSAAATEATPTSTAVGAAAVLSSAGTGVAVDGRLGVGGGVQLGVIASGQALGTAYFGGRSAEGVVAGEVMLLA